jgi:hypothetical protein
VAPPQYGADGLADRRGAAQRTARPLHAGRNGADPPFDRANSLLSVRQNRNLRFEVLAWRMF